MLYLKYLLGWVNFAVMILLRILVILVGTIIVPPFQYYAFKRCNPKLPKFLWIWDNDEDSFYGAKWYIDVKDKEGWSRWRTSFVWNIIRNPANNLRYIGYGINFYEVDERIYEYTSFMDTDIDYTATPYPRVVREHLEGGTYIHRALIRKGWLYYPIYRKVKCLPDNEYYEFRIGFKYTPKWLKDSLSGDYEVNKSHETRTPTIQYTKRPDSYWA